MKRESQNAGGRLDASFHLKRDARTFGKKGDKQCVEVHTVLFIKEFLWLSSYTPFRLFSQINIIERIFMT